MRLTKDILVLKSPSALIPLLVSLELLFLGAISLFQQYKFLPSEIPLWYTRIFFFDRLTAPQLLLLLPLAEVSIIISNILLVEIALREKEHLIANALSVFTLVNVFFINFSLFRIILLSAPAEIIFPKYLLTLLLSSLIAFIISFFLTPIFIKSAWRFSIIDDPATHKHPAILHTKKTPRGGTVPAFVAFLIVSLLFIPLTKQYLGLYLGASVAVITGVLDDKYDLNPYLRLFVFMPLAIALVVGAGIGITFFANPFDGIVRLDTVDIQLNILGEHHILLLADAFAFLWMLWVMNMLSWSNGVDGQFPGIVIIACLVVGLLSLRFIHYDPSQLGLATLAFITVGAMLGTVPFTWHPAKIFYGFGATTLGLILATLSILSGAKVATALLVLIVPTLDALFTISRRLWERHSPVWADRKHLHHRLLDLGWSHQRVAIFYWLLTAAFGLLALYSSGKTKLLSIIAGVGVVAFILIAINWKKSRLRLMGAE